MDQIFTKVTASAATYATAYAIRTGVNWAGSLAAKRLTKFIQQSAPESSQYNLDLVKSRLEQKILAITPAVDLIELIAARGNSSLQNLVPLIQRLRDHIDEFSEYVNEKDSLSPDEENLEEASKDIYTSCESLLKEIEQTIPLINLSLTTSGVTLSSALKESLSPSRLLQAQAFLELSDKQFEETQKDVQIGPKFVLTLYNTFHRSNQSDGPSDVSWKEEYPKCSVYVKRFVSEERFRYVLIIEEDLNDGRYHEELLGKDLSSSISGNTIEYPINCMSILCYTVSGKLLDIPQSRSPVLAVQLMQTFPTDEPSSTSISSTERDVSLDNGSEDKSNKDSLKSQTTDWIALERYMDVYEEASSDSETELNSESRSASDSEEYSKKLSKVKCNTTKDTRNTTSSEEEIVNAMHSLNINPTTSIYLSNPNSLSLLEYILRLCALQEVHQKSCSEMSDEQLSDMLVNAWSN
ncbi:ran GTPase binding protein [Schizosaccharomyces cryophilus OY26]|uniref:Ran GTPase binding protein n=1 Tax=Schizosaccharomyces cryophilus (strain OY26 / ATCC MYA-4695 / CBS 11777 / NBRC 106824 / NRRL Y48691) TaxID=653667 RepID=S9WY80_SCHCR|nr:ran GTPase binding protein [Schizosaccharomyces cryophilus OY26]EPY49687.1 ran GTPase binding protein [Schizosaccharomyces cryophilus OY26]